MLLRKLLAFLGAGIFYVALSSYTYAQNPSQTDSQGASKTPPQASTAPATTPANAPSDSTLQPNEPASLADLARLARAKKPGAAKPVKVLDDDNFVRANYPAEKPAAGSGATSQAQGVAGQSHGKLVLLDFWASWCGPCRSALPGLKRLQSLYGEQLQVISISADDDEQTWRTFVAQHDMRWEQRFDGDGSMRAQYGVNAFPTYILLGPDGKVVQRLVGEDPAQSIAERLGPSLRASAESPR
jgi:thiol-disulfide isomerase/thioredoxin